MNKMWITKQYGYTPMLEMPLKGSTKVRDLSHKMVVEVLEETDGVYLRVRYGVSEGWMERQYLEAYHEVLIQDCVDLGTLQTPDPHDAQQYILWKGTRQVNMCGEMCVAYLLDIPLELLLTKWEVKEPPFYKRIFGSGRASGTTDVDLVKLFSVFDRTVTRMTGTIPYYTPENLSYVDSIVSCRMDTVTGRLNGGGVGHWVAPVGFFAERCGYGTVEIYNPYPNRIEIYSWAEFAASCRQPYGIYY